VALLIGVAAIDTVSLPGAPSGGDTAPLEPGHSGFVLVPGDKWGAESPWLAEIATRIAGERPSVTLVINGGMITYDDEHSLAHNRGVVVLAGSGCTADAIGDAAAGREDVTNHRARTIIESPLVRVINVHDGADVADVAASLHELLS
jgi:hypothetical protein